MIQLSPNLRHLPAPYPPHRIRLIALISSLATATVDLIQAISQPASNLPLHIAFCLLIVTWAVIYYAAFQYSVYALTALILLAAAYYDQGTGILAFFILASTFLSILTVPTKGIFLLATAHIVGEIVTAYTLQQPFNVFSLSISLFLFIGIPLALRTSWEQKRTLAQEYEDFREQVAESNRALARELHDTVARHISVIGLTTERGLISPTTDDKDAALHTIEENTHKALVDMRLLIRTARGDHDPTSLPQTSAPTVDLRHDLEEARAHLTRHGFTLNDTITIKLKDIPDGVRPTFHKLIHEITHNATKYAQPGSTITVTAKPNLTGVTITTSNPAKPTPKDKKNTRGTGFGLVGITERITRLGGTINYGITDGTWNLTIHLPLVV